MRVLVILGGECTEREGQPDQHCVIAVTGPYDGDGGREQAQADRLEAAAAGYVAHWTAVRPREDFFSG